MKYKVGQILFQAWTDVDPDTNRLSGGINEYQVRTIKGGHVYAIQKEKGVTWVKRSKKHFDWGWSDNIPYYYRKNWKVDEAPRDVYTTIRGAWVAHLKTMRWWEERWKNRGEDLTDVRREILYTQYQIKALTKKKS